MERRLLRLNDELERLAEEERLAAGELEMHRHLDDDARRDAAVSDSPVDRADAYQSGKEVARFERVLVRIRGRRAKLEMKRQRLTGLLGD
jgi:hypothetical protein